MVWETFWEWVGKDGAIILPYFFFLSLLFLLPLPSPWPHLFTLLFFFLFAQMWFARGKAASSQWLTYRTADAGTPWKTWSHILFRDISALHSTSSHCSLLHYPSGDIWMEINGFFTLFPMQICLAVDSLGEWARDHWHELLPAPGRGTKYRAGGHFMDYFYCVVTWKTENYNSRPRNDRA